MQTRFVLHCSMKFFFSIALGELRTQHTANDGCTEHVLMPLTCVRCSYRWVDITNATSPSCKEFYKGAKEKMRLND